MYRGRSFMFGAGNTRVWIFMQPSSLETRVRRIIIKKKSLCRGGVALSVESKTLYIITIIYIPVYIYINVTAVYIPDITARVCVYYNEISPSRPWESSGWFIVSGQSNYCTAAGRRCCVFEATRSPTSAARRAARQNPVNAVVARVCSISRSRGPASWPRPVACTTQSWTFARRAV